MNELSTFDRIEQSLREVIDIDELREARARGWLIEDPERKRARYFAGRFLAASDLTRDQQYFASRQRDLGRMSGGGVISGLELQKASPVTLTIATGHGVTPAGDSVMLQRTVTVDVTDVPAIQRLDATFGLEVRPRAPIRNLSGLFVIALRNVEFTANPVATYPKDLQSQRRIEDGEIVEATAVTLIPFETVAAADLGEAGRARLAREIFLRGIATNVPAEALPIGVVSLRRGSIEWVDRYLVRRDASVDDALGFGLPHRAVRDAFLKQYQEHLDVLAPLGSSAVIVASDHFSALPPFGPLPSQALQLSGDQLIQSFFPPEYSVELSLVPDDELAALQEEAVTLPPFDLRARTAVAQATAVIMLLPVPRSELANLASRLEGRLTRAPLPRAMRTRARHDLISLLTEQRARLLHRPDQLPVAVNLQPWQDALETIGTGRLFYVRRRSLSQVAFSFVRFQSLPPDAPNPSETLSNLVVARLVAAGELPQPDDDLATQTQRKRFDYLLRGASAEVVERIEALLSRPLFARPLFVQAAVAELAYRTRVRLEDLLISAKARASVIGNADGVVAAEGSAPVRVRALRPTDVERVEDRYGREQIGQGFDTVPSAELTPELSATLAESFRVPELDQTLRKFRKPAERLRFTQQLLAAAADGDIGALRDLVDLRFAPPDEEAFPPIEGFPGSRTASELGEGRLYRLIHTFADDTIKRRLSELFDPGNVDRVGLRQASIVSMLLGECLVLGWDLNLTSGDQFDRVNTLFTKVLNWDPSDPSFPVEDLGGDANVNGDNSSLIDMLNEYASLAAEADIESLDEVFDQGGEGIPSERDRFRMLGLAGASFNLIRRVLQPNPNETAFRLVGALRRLTDSGVSRDAESATYLNKLADVAAGAEI